MQTTPSRTALLIAGLAAMTALAGCASNDSGGSGDSTASREAPAVAPDVRVEEAAPSSASAYDADSANSADGGAGDSGGARKADDGTAQGPSVISTGIVSLEAKDVAKARLGVRKVVDEHGGTVSEQETTTGDEKGELTTARLVLRVPSERFDDVVTALEGIATPTGTTTSGQDVSAEVVDVEARVRAQRKSVERIEALLAQATSIQEIVSIESQLASRQADLDSLQSRQRWLADQTSLSTVTVYLQQPGEDRDTDEPKDRDGFLGGLQDGWDAFVTGFAAVLTVLGFLLPWLVIVALIGVPLWRVLRRRRSRSAGVPQGS